MIGMGIISKESIKAYRKQFTDSACGYNDASNIMIVCPNHHSIIHDRNPEFNTKEKTYKYPNGYVEVLKLNSQCGYVSAFNPSGDAVAKKVVDKLVI
ncbi:MAG: hypothetical protein IKH57_12195 [Clostridia bacterium]|nr:hypothetical protein [Clostridia bacterium]